MGYPFDLPELHNLKLEIGNNHDQEFHFPSHKGKWQNLNFQKIYTHLLVLLTAKTDIQEANAVIRVLTLDCQIPITS